MSYQDIEPMSSVEQDWRRKQLDEACEGADPRVEYARQMALEAEQRELEHRRIGGRIERGETINGVDG